MSIKKLLINLIIVYALFRFNGGFNKILILLKIMIATAFTNQNINNIFTIARKIIMYVHEQGFSLVGLNENDEQEMTYPGLW